MRIALLSHRFPPSLGGIERHVARLATEYARLGHEVTVLTHRHEGAPDVDVSGDVVVRRLPAIAPTRHLAVSPTLGRVLRTAGGDYDVVHAHGYHDSLAAIAARTWRGPLVFTPHYHGASESALRNLLHVPYRSLVRPAVGRSDALVFVSPSEREAFCRRFPSAVDRSRVVSNGVDVERFASATPAPSDPTGRRRLVTACRLDHYKRVDRVLGALAALGADHRLDVVGVGPARGELEVLARRLGVADRTTFHGRLPDGEVASLVAGADTVVSLSEHEAQGIVLLEARAAGTAVVASTIPAHADVAAVTPGITLVDDDLGHTELAAVLRRATSTPAPPVEIADWRLVAAATLDVYAEAVVVHHQRRPTPARRRVPTVVTR